MTITVTRTETYELNPADFADCMVDAFDIYFSDEVSSEEDLAEVVPNEMLIEFLKETVKYLEKNIDKFKKPCYNKYIK